ncbi:MAG: VWA domain-containing protein [Lachnospiraceae bacterium]|nr:VWA domain-containing protein [Lachnospiraceae bacterium]
MKFEIARPLVLILLPVLLVFTIWSARYLYTHKKTQRITRILARSFLLTLVVLALSGLSIKWTTNRTTTIFLVDVSDSVREQTNEVISFVNSAVREKGHKDYVGIISFGSNAEVEQFVSQEVAFSELQTDVNKTATNLEEAVRMAVSMMPEDSAKRLVLITDGCENEGSVKNTIAAIGTTGVTVQAYQLEENTSDEVYVSDVTIPKDVGLGEVFNINVEVVSNIATTANVSLYMGRTLKAQQTVQLQKGVNHFIFTDTQTDEGLKTYNVTVEAASDTVSVNNEYSAYTNISVTQPVLIVEGSSGEGKEIENILDSVGIRHETVVPAAAPDSISEMMNYSAIVFANVYADDLRKGFTDALPTYIKDYGGGFICTGGPDSYALGMYDNTPIEDVLPVNMELEGEEVVPDVAMVMVIDHSGSMDAGGFGHTYLDVAKESAVAALDNLRPNDHVGVLAFDDRYTWASRLAKLDDKAAVERQIAGIPSGGGTSIYPALEEAYKAIRDDSCMVKHIILLTDGEDGYPYSYYTNLLQRINQDGITVSTVAMGSGCNTTLLQAIADDCGGRMYMADVDTDLPRIFAQEVYLTSQSYIRNEEFTPVITNSHEMIDGVMGEGTPTLMGYIATSKKNNTIPVLETSAGDPLLSVWQYGLGRSVAWTSDFTGKWSANWSSWEQTQRLWFNMITYVTQNAAIEGAYTEVEQEGNKATVVYHTDEYDGETRVMATITDDQGNSKEVEMIPESPGVYKTSFQMEGTGVYSVGVKQYENDEIKGSLNTAAIMQYSIEYQFMSAINDLDGFIKSVSGTFIENPSEVFSSELEEVRSKTNLSTILLSIAAFCFAVDIAIRRFHIDLFAPVAAIGNVVKDSKKKAAARKAEEEAEGGKKKGKKKKKKPAGKAPAGKAAPTAAMQGQAPGQAPGQMPGQAPGQAGQPGQPQQAPRPAAKKARKPEPRQMLDTGAMIKNRDENQY